MRHNQIRIKGSDLSLEQLVLEDETLVTCIPDLGPVQWRRDQLIGEMQLSAKGPNPASSMNITESGSADTLSLSFNIYLVQSRAGNILIDTGIGSGKHRADRPAWDRLRGPLLAILEGLGLSTIDINFVVNTHLHADHVGWNTIIDASGVWRPTFPAAVYVTPALELEAMLVKARAASSSSDLLHGAWEDSVMPIIDGPGYLTVQPGEMFAGLQTIALPGHTPGMIGLILSSGNQTIVFTADAIHHPVQLSNNVPASNFCINPEESVQTRIELLETCARNDWVIAPYHFPTPAFSRIKRNEATGYEIEPLGVQEA
ncbi:MBL fold metallo-hydrolase [Agrobacterium pusense]|uniref:MBL fold metallo-hydrolase n=1 Tax=Agrobacterium pusense TaxID=648995 RepID=UPI00156ADD0F|nr:MBL fold metallo-hydrolase [Agrobacterium pusense]QKJ94452.1 MBL fold metallo-hydrolase [Agrobacterium pusense]